MRKILPLIALCMACFCNRVDAQELVTRLTVTLTDGTEELYNLTDSPKVTMPGNEMKIVSATAEVSFARTDVKSITFTEGEYVGLNNVETAANYQVTYVNRQLTVSGADITAVDLFDVNGRQVASVKANNGIASTSLTSLPVGVYIVRIAGHQSLKIRN